MGVPNPQRNSPRQANVPLAHHHWPLFNLASDIVQPVYSPSGSRAAHVRCYCLGRARLLFPVGVAPSKISTVFEPPAPAPSLLCPPLPVLFPIPFPRTKTPPPVPKLRADRVDTQLIRHVCSLPSLPPHHPQAARQTTCMLKKTGACCGSRTHKMGKTAV